jgi:hypothetical protein
MDFGFRRLHLNTITVEQIAVGAGLAGPLLSTVDEDLASLIRGVWPKGRFRHACRHANELTSRGAIAHNAAANRFVHTRLPQHFAGSGVEGKKLPAEVTSED